MELKHFENRIKAQRIFDLKMNAYEALFDHMDEQLREMEVKNLPRSRSAAKTISFYLKEDPESLDEELAFEIPQADGGSEGIMTFEDNTKRIVSGRFPQLELNDLCNFPVHTDEEKLDNKTNFHDWRISSRFHQNFIKKINIETP